MKLELAQFILQACENADTFFEGEDMPTIYENYSGRGMFGKKTTAIVCKSIMPVMAAIAYECMDEYSDAFIPEIEISDIRHFQMDSMGRDSVVIY